MISRSGSMLSSYELLASEKHLELHVVPFLFIHAVANLTRQPRVSVTVLYLGTWLEPQGHACTKPNMSFTACPTTDGYFTLRFHSPRIHLE